MGYEATVTFYKRLGNWRWRVTHANTKKVGASTESYTKKNDAVHNFEWLTGRTIENPGADSLFLARGRGSIWEVTGLTELPGVAAEASA